MYKNILNIYQLNITNANFYNYILIQMNKYSDQMLHVFNKISLRDNEYCCLNVYVSTWWLAVILPLTVYGVPH